MMKQHDTDMSYILNHNFPIFLREVMESLQDWKNVIHAPDQRQTCVHITHYVSLPHDNDFIREIK